MPFNIGTQYNGPVWFRSQSCKWAPGRVRWVTAFASSHYCQWCSTVDGRVVTAATYSTPLHLALSTASTPCLPLEWPVSVADCNNTTTRNVQAFFAADIRASQLVFITTAVVPGTLTIPGRSFYCPGTRSSPGTRTPGYMLTGLHVTISTSCVQQTHHTHAQDHIFKMCQKTRNTHLQLTVHNSSTTAAWTQYCWQDSQWSDNTTTHEAHKTRTPA